MTPDTEPEVDPVDAVVAWLDAVPFGIVLAAAAVAFIAAVAYWAGVQISNASGLRF